MKTRFSSQREAVRQLEEELGYCNSYLEKFPQTDIHI